MGVMMHAQNCRLWKQESARGGARRGRASAGTRATATGSAGTGKVRFMEPATLSSRDSPASATSGAEMIQNQESRSRSQPLHNPYIYT